MDVGEHHLQKMDTIVDPLVVSDLATVVWSPHGHPRGGGLAAAAGPGGADRLRERAGPGGGRGPARTELEERAYVVDLAWLRSTPWRERVAATFDPPRLRRELGAISVGDRAPPSRLGRSPGLLFFGWLASRLGWEPGNVMTQDGALYGPLPRPAPGRGAAARARPHDDRARASRGSRSRPRSAPRSTSNRGPGGLSARRRTQGRQRGVLDGARRLARRGRHPRRGHPPGAPARPHLRAGARGGAARCSGERVRGRRRRGPGSVVPADRPVRLPVRLRDLRAGGAERQRRVALPAALRLAERVRRDPRPRRRRLPPRPGRRGGARRPPLPARARWCSRRAGARAAAGSSCATCC